MASADTLVMAYETYRTIKRNFATDPLANIATCDGMFVARRGR